MEVLPGPLPDGRRSSGDKGLGSRLIANKHGFLSISNGCPDDWALHEIAEANLLCGIVFTVHQASSELSTFCGLRSQLNIWAVQKCAFSYPEPSTQSKAAGRPLGNVCTAPGARLDAELNAAEVLQRKRLVVDVVAGVGRQLVRLAPLFNSEGSEGQP